MPMPNEHSGYLAKYLAKERPECLYRWRLWAGFGKGWEWTKVKDVVRESLFTEVYRACKEWKAWTGRGKFGERMDLVRRMIVLTIERGWKAGSGPCGKHIRWFAKLTFFCEKDFVADFAEDLIGFVRMGRAICGIDEAWAAHAQFTGWTAQVSEGIRKEGSSELVLEWETLPGSPLEKFQMGPADSVSWARFCEAVETRCRWLGQLPRRISAAPERIQSSALAAGRKEIQVDAKGRAFVDPSRVEELKQISSDKFDFSKLIRMCEEINICFTGECYLAVAMLTRAILDHIPPIFGADTFAQVVNNCTGTKSFKASMETLDNSSRKIADQHLHSQIRQAEVLPNATQVDFAPALDVLLGEIVRIHKGG